MNIRDTEDNNRYMNEMERYFREREEDIHRYYNNKLQDAYLELNKPVEEILQNMDFKIVEKFVRRRKMININKRTKYKF